jgi:hypothetical protein
VSGTVALGNGANGVDCYLGASNNTIGGTDASARNVISGNLGSGVDLQIGDTTGNVVEGNLSAWMSPDPPLWATRKMVWTSMVSPAM